MIEENARASVAELSQIFSVSQVTIRKDLAILETEGTTSGTCRQDRWRYADALEKRAPPNDVAPVGFSR